MARVASDILPTLERILEIGAVELESALTEAADAVATATGAEKVDVFLRDGDAEVLVAVGVSETPLGRRQRALGLDRLPFDHGGRTIEVYRSREPWV